MLRALLSLACATAIAVGDIALQPDQTGGDHQRRQLRTAAARKQALNLTHAEAQAREKQAQAHAGNMHRRIPHDHMSVKPSKVNLAKPPVVGLEKRPMAMLEKPPMAMLEKPGYLPQPASSHQLHVKPVEGAAAIHQPHVRPDAIAQHQPLPFSFNRHHKIRYPHHTAPKLDKFEALFNEALFTAQKPPLAAMTHSDAVEFQNYAKQLRDKFVGTRSNGKYEAQARSLEKTANTLESLHQEAGVLRRKEGDLNERARQARGPPRLGKGRRRDRSVEAVRHEAQTEARAQALELQAAEARLQAMAKEVQAAETKAQALDTLIKDKTSAFGGGNAAEELFGSRTRLQDAPDPIYGYIRPTTPGFGKYGYDQDALNLLIMEKRPGKYGYTKKRVGN